ncbi:hypothetical protein C8J56DRAFT_1050416 [Mycena floridula]|nr:hypothetical protein C8J56DRAFT_1050416 [Mycena floridula]
MGKAKKTRKSPAQLEALAKGRRIHYNTPEEAPLPPAISVFPKTPGKPAKNLSRVPSLQSPVRRAAFYERETQNLSKVNARLRNRAEILKQEQKSIRKDLAAKCAEVKQVITKAASAAERTFSAFSQSSQLLSNNLNQLAEKHSRQKADLMASRKLVHALKARCYRAANTMAKVKSKQQTPTVAHLKTKGAFTEKFRSLARTLVRNGCSANKVGPMMQAVGKALGISVSVAMSSWTVRRTILEGGIAAKLQLAYEVSHAPAFTASGDSTSNRKINFQSHHIAVRVPNYSSKGDIHAKSAKSIPKNRFLGLQATIDHSSEVSKLTWVKQYTELVDLYAKSPLGQKQNRVKKLELCDFAVKLRAMNGDHANGEKSAANLVEEWKHEVTIDGLGMDAIRLKTAEELFAVLQEWNIKKVDDAGEERATQDVATLAAVIKSVREAAFEALPAPEKRELTLFLWTGCCMHKEQNSFKGGNSAMVAAWKALGAQGPMILANKWNSQAVKQALAPEKGSEPVTAEELAVLEASTAGGVKLACLAGTIFDNKDDKKGQGDSHVIHLEGQWFPDTSNTHFASYGDAADELIDSLDDYREYLLLMRDVKQTAKFNNLKKNVLEALHDPPTLTELVVLSLANQNITKPYLSYVRQRGLNGLSLGPYHKTVVEHLDSVLEDPGRWLDPEKDAKLCTLDEDEWARPSAVAAARKLAPSLPLVKEMIVAFVRGMKGTFIRFASEYAPGGLIDGATDEEKDLAWTATTNDVNEGLLGTYRVDARKNPTRTLHQFNHLRMWAHNQTQKFIQRLLTDEDMQFIRKTARQVDGSGLEKKWRNEHKAADLKKATEKREKVAKDAQKKRDEFTILARASANMLTSVDGIPGLTVVQLQLQLNILKKLYSVPNIPVASKMKLKADKAQALTTALTLFLSWPVERRFPVDFPQSVTGEIDDSIEDVAPTDDDELEADP